MSDKELVIFIVQNIEGVVTGVYRDIHLASSDFDEQYKSACEMLKEFGLDIEDEDIFYDCDFQPMITIWRLNGGYMDTLYTPKDVQEAKEAIEKGVVYD